MDKVSVEAFDRTAMALVKVIQEDAWIIDGLRADNAKLIENGRQRWSDYEKMFLEFEELKAKIGELLALCDEQDALADEYRVGRDDNSIAVSEIREIFKP